MQTTRTLAHKNSTRSSLPNISAPVSYSQRYEHMTKIANYNEMNEAQIWKQYQKLRSCLKQLNEEVLYHMEKKAHTNLYAKEAPLSPSVQATLILLQQEDKTNQARLQIFVNEYGSLEQRLQHLTNKRDFLLEINNDIEITEAKIRQLTNENKDLKRRQKLLSKDLVNEHTFLDKLLFEEEALHYANKKFQKYDKIYKQAISKIEELEERQEEYQKAIEVRLNQFKSQENYIEEEINLQRYEQLQDKKINAQRFESVYKKNYLMKLKELQNLVNSIKRHDQVIQQTEGNILKMRSQIDTISSTIGTGKKKHSNSMVQDYSLRSGRKSIIGDVSMESKENEVRKTRNHKSNDKNRGDSRQRH